MFDQDLHNRTTLDSLISSRRWTFCFQNLLQNCQEELDLLLLIIQDQKLTLEGLDQTEHLISLCVWGMEVSVARRYSCIY